MVVLAKRTRTCSWRESGDGTDCMIFYAVEVKRVLNGFENKSVGAFSGVFFFFFFVGKLRLSRVYDCIRMCSSYCSTILCNVMIDNFFFLFSMFGVRETFEMGFDG